MMSGRDWERESAQDAKWVRNRNHCFTLVCMGAFARHSIHTIKIVNGTSQNVQSRHRFMIIIIIAKLHTAFARIYLIKNKTESATKKNHGWKLFFLICFQQKNYIIYMIVDCAWFLEQSIVTNARKKNDMNEWIKNEMSKRKIITRATIIKRQQE